MSIRRERFASTVKDVLMKRNNPRCRGNAPPTSAPAAGDSVRSRQGRPWLFHRFGKLLVALALAFSLGAHWAALQTVAWVGMLATYSQETSFAEAVIRTFDGEHPCRLCLAIQKSRDAGEKQDKSQPNPDAKIIAVLCRAMDFDFLPPAPAAFAEPVSVFTRSDQPPLPPPRFVLSPVNA